MFTRSQKRRINLQESIENVSESIENVDLGETNVKVAGASRAKSSRVENRALERPRTSLKKEVTSEIKDLLLEYQNELLKILKPKTGVTSDKENKLVPEQNSQKILYSYQNTQKQSPQICGSTQCRNMVTGIITGSKNHQKKSKVQSQRHPASKKRTTAAKPLFAPELSENPTFPMAKLLAASLPTSGKLQ